MNEPRPAMISARPPETRSSVAKSWKTRTGSSEEITLMHARREAPELGWGTSTPLENEPAALFAHRCDSERSTVFAIRNLSGEPVAAEPDLGEEATGGDDLLEVRE